MKKEISNHICEIEYEFSKIENMIKVLKDAVENNDDTYYLLDYIEIIDKKVQNFADNLENYNQKVSKIIML